MQKRRVKLGRSSCRITRELSEKKSKTAPYFYGVLEDRRWDMNDLEAATFENGWLAYTVKAAD